MVLTSGNSEPDRASLGHGSAVEACWYDGPSSASERQKQNNKRLQVSERVTEFLSL